MSEKGRSAGNPIRVAVVGLGNIGRFAVDAVRAAPDLELAGIVRRQADRPAGIDRSVPVATSPEELGQVDVALLCLPSREVPGQAERYLASGIHTVDSYDIHGELVDVRNRLDQVAKSYDAVAIVSAGWDPGTDSMLRAMFEFMAPRGVTYTNFGPGMSMGHTVAAKAVSGVKDALSITLPAGQGVHRRAVYVELEEGASLDQVTNAINDDPYFARDETRVTAVPSVRDLIDVGHGVTIERKGVSGETHNQRFAYEMRVNNPALTSQVMVAAARAATRRSPGAYTTLEVPVVDFLPGDRDELLRRLV